MLQPSEVKLKSAESEGGVGVFRHIAEKICVNTLLTTVKPCFVWFRGCVLRRLAEFGQKLLKILENDSHLRAFQ